jgi:hypothetical protein
MKSKDFLKYISYHPLEWVKKPKQDYVCELDFYYIVDSEGRALRYGRSSWQRNTQESVAESIKNKLYGEGYKVIYVPVSFVRHLNEY